MALAERDSWLEQGVKFDVLRRTRRGHDALGHGDWS